MTRVKGLAVDPDMILGCGGPDLHLRLVPAPWIFIIAFAPHPAGVPEGAPHPS